MVQMTYNFKDQFVDNSKNTNVNKKYIACFTTSHARLMLYDKLDYLNENNKKRSHTQLDSRKQVIAFQDRVTTINIKEAQHPLKQEKQVIDKSSIMLKISTKSMHRVLV